MAQIISQWSLFVIEPAALPTSSAARLAGNFGGGQNIFAIIQLDSLSRVQVLYGNPNVLQTVANDIDLNQVLTSVSSVFRLENGNQFTPTQFNQACSELSFPNVVTQRDF